MELEDLRPGASVISSDGHKLGTLSRFVVRRDTFTLTHIVVDTGIFRSGEPLWKGGWGMSHDRVVPRGALDHVSSAELGLTMTADEFRDLAVDYVHESFSAIADEKPRWPDLSDVARLATAIPGEPGPYLMYEKMAIAPDAVDIQKDSPVWRLKPHQKIGEVDGLIFDERTGRVASLVVRRGHIFKKDVELPVTHIVEVVADIVRVEIDDAGLAQLKEHRPGS